MGLEVLLQEKFTLGAFVWEYSVIRIYSGIYSGVIYKIEIINSHVEIKINFADTIENKIFFFSLKVQ